MTVGLFIRGHNRISYLEWYSPPRTGWESLQDASRASRGISKDLGPCSFLSSRKRVQSAASLSRSRPCAPRINHGRHLPQLVLASLVVLPTFSRRALGRPALGESELPPCLTREVLDEGLTILLVLEQEAWFSCCCDGCCHSWSLGGQTDNSTVELLWALRVYGEMTFLERIVSLKLLLFS